MPPARTRWFIAASRCAALVGLLGPPEGGTDMTMGIGYGSYSYSSDAFDNRTDYRAFELRARHRAANGITAAAEGFGDIGKVVSSQPPGSGELGRNRNVYALALRLGYHGRYGGVEIGGVNVAGVPAQQHDAYNYLSAGLWLGVPELHMWGALFANQTLSPQRAAGMGLGHAGRHIRIDAGQTVAGPMLDVAARLHPRLWLGAGINRDDGANWGAVMRLTWIPLWSRGGG